MAKLSRQQEELKRVLEQLIAAQPDDQRLRDHLEGVARQELFSGLTWLWGPPLYRRNPALFRPLIMNHFSEWANNGRERWRRVEWAEHREALERWLDEARGRRDVQLVRRLLRWRYAGRGWRPDFKAWRHALIEAYRAAPSPAARVIVLDEFAEAPALDEATAISLYQIDRGAGAFIRDHLPSGFWAGEKRQLWSLLGEKLRAAGDDELYFALYRRLVSEKLWRAEITRLAQSLTDPAQLDQALEQRHPAGSDIDLASALLELLEQRGREVMPYIRRHLSEVIGSWRGEGGKRFVQLAKRRGWWDLWAEAVRGDRRPALFNQEIDALLDDTTLSDERRQERLAALAGISREWNWPGLGVAQLHTLKESTALRLYAAYPEVLRGPFRANILPSYFVARPKMVAAARDAKDHELMDALASRYATLRENRWARAATTRNLESAGELANYYEAIRDHNPVEFARRAANCLTRIPAYAIYDYRQLLKENPLARLLFVRSFAAYLELPEAVQDLVEGSDIHVQLLAYRILAQDEERARRQAVSQLDILLGTLLRPLHRKTRLPAFDALVNAAKADREAAVRVLNKARAALRLPDRRYPKEELIGLIGRVLHAQPSLRGELERPRIYGLAAGVAE